MPWTNIIRVEYKRSPARYPSDLTDEEWALIGPLLPPAKPGGRPRSTKLRDVMDGILAYRFQRLSVAHAAKVFAATLHHGAAPFPRLA